MDRLHRRLPALVALVTACLTASCTGDGGATLSPNGSPRAAKGGGSPVTVTVTATAPAYGSPGSTNESVTITGSGFQNGAQAAWLQLNDSLDTTITVLSTQFVNSSTVTSVINISNNSPIAFRNVRVTNADRTKGIGNAVFEVTQAIPVPGTGGFKGVTDDGELAGTGASTGAVWWSAGTGLVMVDTGTAEPQSLSPLGSVIPTNGLPRIYTRTGSIGAPWVLTKLPANAAAIGGGAFALLADPSTDQPVMVIGRIKIPVSRKTTTSEPLLWTWQAGTSSWQSLILPSGAQGSASPRAISTDTTIAGWLGYTSSCCEPGATTTAAVWHRDNTGAWQVTAIGPAGSGAEAINSAGTTIVGMSGGKAVYWVRGADGTWGSPITLPGACAEAKGVDGAGEILVNGCLSSTGEPAGVMVPPYSASNIRFLGGLGHQNAAAVTAISPSGQYVAGSAGAGGVYWKLY